MNDADRWSLFAAHALQGLLAAPLGSIAPDQVLTIDALSTMAASYADELVLQCHQRFQSGIAPEIRARLADAQLAELRGASESAGGTSAELDAERGEHLSYARYVELVAAESRGK